MLQCHDREIFSSTSYEDEEHTGKASGLLDAVSLASRDSNEGIVTASSDTTYKESVRVAKETCESSRTGPGPGGCTTGSTNELAVCSCSLSMSGQLSVASAQQSGAVEVTYIMKMKRGG